MKQHFEISAKKRRQKAILWTIVFHIALIGSIAYATSNRAGGIITTVKSWFGNETPVATAHTPKA